MTDMNCRDCRLELHGYLDNELDTVRALEVHRHLLSCKNCQQEYQQMRQLGQLVREQADAFKAPDDLLNKIRKQIGKADTAPESPSLAERFRNWRLSAFAPAISLAALACAAFLYVATPSGGDIADEAVSEHVRSLMAQHITDVASSDRHTVKPWFIGKLDFAPPVYDFATQGYTLIGGRMDYLQSQTTAALVYEHNKHIINLFITPTTDTDSIKTTGLKKRGYNLLTWRQNHMAFIAVSDMDASGLKNLGDLLRNAVASQ